MPPRYLRKASPTRLKHCQEFTVEACDTAPADQCCGTLPCRLCLEFQTYEDGIAYGSADFGTSSWTGTVGGGSFVAYWERNYETDECEFVVNFDGEEVYRATCYEGASCRNPAGEVAASIGYEEGTLRWSVYEPRELALIDDPETGCRDFFCGTCRCTCDCLCVTITEPYGNVIQGELCTSSYPCDPPVWEGTLGYYDLSIALGRDEYTGECIISLTANGEEPEPVFVTGCADMSASVTLYDGTVISVACKLCACDQQAPSCPCCPGWPETASGSVDWTSIAAPSDCGASGPGENPTGDFSCPETGDETGVLIRSDATFLYVRVFCDADTGIWQAQYRSAISGGIFEPPVSLTWADATDFEFVCPDCADAIDGQATGTIDFTAKMACETSGGVVEYDVVVHGDFTIGCP